MITNQLAETATAFMAEYGLQSSTDQKDGVIQDSGSSSSRVPTEMEMSPQAVDTWHQAQASEQHESPEEYDETDGGAERTQRELSWPVDKSRPIQSLNGQIKLLTSEKCSLQQANNKLARELENSRAEVELLLARVDNFNARIGCYYRRLSAPDLPHCSCCLCHRRRKSNSFACGSQNLSGRPNSAKPSWLDAASRILIDRRIVQLEARAQQLDEPKQSAENLGSFAAMESRVSGTPIEPESKSQENIARRIQSLDDRIQELIGARPYGTELMDDEAVHGGAAIATSTPLVSRPQLSDTSISVTESFSGSIRIDNSTDQQDDTVRLENEPLS